MTSAYPTLPDATHPAAIWSLVTAASVTILVAGQLAVCLVLGSWAIAGLLGLADFVLIALWIVSCGVSVAIAVPLFLRVMRIEMRLAENKPIDDIGWNTLQD
jgi:hypothetical protein